MAKGAFFRTERNYRVKTTDISRICLVAERNAWKSLSTDQGLSQCF
jgi:hypothetical protein